ncbi:MAG: rhomboid family intramembrane serine protease [Candidatus Puniceispirillales bacterium]
MFFLPLYDDNTPQAWPIVTWFLIFCCIVVFLFQQAQPPYDARLMMLQFATIPALVSGDTSLPVEIAVVPPVLTLLTSTFLHGGWLHLGGNMLYLWIFGDNVEDRMGPVRFTIFYVLCGIAASLAHVAVNPQDPTPLVGASGAIAGVLAAYLLMFPRAKVRVLMVIIIFIRWIYLPAFVVLGAWLLLQVFAAPGSLDQQGGTAYFAHLGGFVAGLVLTPFFRKKGVPLMQSRDDLPQDHVITPVPMATVRNEFVERYRHRKRPSRRGVPDVKRNDHRSGPWG